MHHQRGRGGAAGKHGAGVAPGIHPTFRSSSRSMSDVPVDIEAALCAAGVGRLAGAGRDGSAAMNGKLGVSETGVSSTVASAAPGARGSSAGTLSTAVGRAPAKGTGLFRWSRARRSTTAVPVDIGAGFGSAGEGDSALERSAPNGMAAASTALTSISRVSAEYACTFGAGAAGHATGFPGSSSPTSTRVAASISARGTTKRPRHTSDASNRSASITSMSARSSTGCSVTSAPDVTCLRASAATWGRRDITRGSAGCIPSSTIHSSPWRRSSC